MEKPKLDWKSFVGRRRLNVSKWLAHHNIGNYNALVKKCDSLNIVPPNKNDVSSFFKVKKVEKPETVKWDVVHFESPVDPVVEDPMPKEEKSPESFSAKKPRKKRKKATLDKADKKE